MINEYFRIIKEIQTLQKQLIGINIEKKFVRNNINDLLQKEKELELKMQQCQSHLKTLLLIEQNKSRIDFKIIEKAKNDIKLLYGEQNNLSVEIFDCKIKISRQEDKYKELESSTLPIKEKLKINFFKRDMLLKGILSTTDKNDNDMPKVK